MNARTLACLLLVAAFLAGCRVPTRRAPPQTPLEKSLYFEERDERGHVYELSSRTPSPQAAAPAPTSTDAGDTHDPVRSLASGSSIDVNSTLAIDVLGGELVARVAGKAALDVPEQLVERARAIGEVLDAHAAVVEARAEALRAWQLLETERDAYAGFVEKRRAFAGLEIESIDRIEKIWPTTHPDREAIEETYDVTAGEIDPEGAATFSALLQEEIDALEAKTRALAQAADERAMRLRIEAFLHPSREQKDPLPVHVPGYDTLDQKQIARIDPYGLALTESERASLEELARASREIAEALERVRRGEATLAEAFRDATAEVSRLIGGYLQQVEALRAEVAAKSLEARLAETRSALDAFLAEVAAIVPDAFSELGDAAIAEIEARSADVSELGDLGSFLGEVTALIRDWKTLEPDTLPELVIRSLAVVRRIPEVIAALGSKDAPLETLFERFERIVEDLPPALRDQVGSAWDRSLGPQADAWTKLVRSARATLAPVKNLLSVVQVPAVSTSLTTPGVIDLPIDQATNTTIDVMRTPRLPGDSLEVRATLLEGGEARETKSQYFRLEKLGWHADIAPSVVFVTADQLEDADDTGGFSPALAWMWRYGPREREDDMLARTSRALGWGAGLHATFLNFDDDHDAAIGLGVSTSLWDDILIFGAGINLFADDDHDGRYYYFVGSSLIALLQKLSPGED